RPRPWGIALVDGQVGDVEFRILHIVATGVGFSAPDQSSLALDADDGGDMPCDWQREIAEAAEQVEDAIARLWIEQTQGLLDHAQVHAAVHLDEVERLE